MTLKCQVNLNVKNTLVSETDALELQLFKSVKEYNNRHVGVTLKIQFGHTIAYTTAYVHGDETIIGRIAIDELSDRI